MWTTGFVSESCMVKWVRMDACVLLGTVISALSKHLRGTTVQVFAVPGILQSYLRLLWMFPFPPHRLLSVHNKKNYSSRE